MDIFSKELNAQEESSSFLNIGDTIPSVISYISRPLVLCNKNVPRDNDNTNVLLHPQNEMLLEELKKCKLENSLLQKQVRKLQIQLTHNTCPICQRVFSDGAVTIRIKCGKRPVFKIVFDEELYSVCWHGIELGYSICRDGLLEEINQTLVFLWNEYAKDADCKMTRSALKIKRLMLSFFEEI